MSSLLTTEQSQRIAVIRAKIAAGEHVELSEYREVIQIQRQGRMQAQTASAASKKKSAKVAIPDADDLLDQLMK